MRKADIDAIRRGNGFRLAVFGSRTLTGEAVASTIFNHIKKSNAGIIVTAAKPTGVCEVARQVAAAVGIPLRLHFLDNAKYAAGKYEARSLEVLLHCDHCLFIHDGKSSGTAGELKLAIKYGVPHTYITMEDE